MTFEKKIKTLVFDLGGVYFTTGSVLAIEKLRDIYELNDTEQYDALRYAFSSEHNTEGYLIRLGLISMEEFEKRLVDRLKLDINNKEHIHYIWFGSYLPNFKMESVLANLKDQGFRLIVFSGNVKERIKFLEDRYQFSQYFDEFVYSFDYEKNKDDIEFYRELIRHLDCSPEEAIFIEDQKKNINMAQSLGFNCIQYYYTEQLIAQLANFNINIDI